MTAKIKLLRSTTTGHIPAALESGQVAINEADDKLFWRHSDGTIKSIDMTLALMATQAWVTSQINNLVSAAPGALDTLDELAAALGDDANFAATITAALGNRVRFDAAQSLSAGQKIQARANIGAGSSDFDGAYNSLIGKPTLGDAAAKNTGTAAGTVAAGDDARITGAAQKTGDETINGIKTFGSIPVGPANDPTSDNQFVRKAYVDAHSGQPIPSSSLLPVGMVVYAEWYPTPISATLADGATASGSYFKNLVIQSGGLAPGPVLSGTWKNISGNTLNRNGTYMGGLIVRTA